VISALVSRSRIFQLRPLDDEQVKRIIERAITDPKSGFGNRVIEIDSDAIDHLVRVSGGDARNALNALELAVETTPPDGKGTIHITLVVAQDSIQRRAILYDKDGDAHYDTISAFIKSIRGSDPDAALYWLAKMLYAGEDPRFILRRLLILASEDIGLADPRGLLVAAAAMQSYEFIGLPEGIYPIVEATLYLASAPKSNSAGAYFKAYKLLEERGVVEVPVHLRDANRDSKALGHGDGYQYPHNHPDHHIGQGYLPVDLLGTYFYQPSDQGYEIEIEERLARWREAQLEALDLSTTEEVEDLSDAQIAAIKRFHVSRRAGDK
jgi:putative ATPase